MAVHSGVVRVNAYGEIPVSPYEVYFQHMKTHRLKVTASGQISLPAALRKRWAASEVVIIDEGDHALIAPMPADLVDSLQGFVPSGGPSIEESRQRERAEDAAAESVRWSS